MNNREEMAWNAPGSGKDNSGGGPRREDGPNPWARRPAGGGGGNGGGFDDLLKQMRDRFGGRFTGPPFLIAAAVVLWLLSGFYTVDNAEQAVVTTFGKYTSTTRAGLHWRVPFPVQRVHKVKMDLIRNISDRAVMLTQDENIVDLEIAVQYKVNSAYFFVFRVRDPELTLAQALKSAVREVVGKEKMDVILTTGREEIETRTRDLLQTAMDDYESGLQVTEVNLKDAQPPEPVQNAFADAIRAREDEQRLKNEAEAYRNDILPKASGNAARQIAEAEAHREQVVAEAEGQASRFSLLLAEYEKAPQVTRKRLYLDAMQSVLSRTGKIVVDGKSGNQMLYLPLDQLLKAQGEGQGQPPLAAPSARGTQPSAPPSSQDFGRDRGRSRN